MKARVKNYQDIEKKHLTSGGMRSYCGKAIEVKKDIAGDYYRGCGFWWHKDALIFPKTHEGGYMAGMWFDEIRCWDNEENKGGDMKIEFWVMVVDRGTEDRTESVVKQPEVRLAKSELSLKTKVASELGKTWKDEYEVLVRPF